MTRPHSAQRLSTGPLFSILGRSTRKSACFSPRSVRDYGEVQVRVGVVAVPLAVKPKVVVAFAARDPL